MVRDGYDHVSYKYRDDAGRGPAIDQAGQMAGRPDYEAWLTELMPLLDEGDSVVDLGCGCDVPATAILADRYAVTGVDISPVQIAREQPAIIKNIYHWLRPGGYLLVTVGSGAWTGTEDDRLGAPMYWSHADRATYIAWLEETGFQVLWTRFIPEGRGGHTLVLAKALGGVQRPAATPTSKSSSAAAAASSSA